MEKFRNIAVLIDADNAQLARLESVLEEVSRHGHIALKRAYGNWKKDILKNWESELLRLAIKAVQQYDYVPGKNATDMALVIDAVELLHTGVYDAFVIVASDSDYTPLAIHLREAGAYVIGIGTNSEQGIFRSSCDEFIVPSDIKDAEEPAAKAKILVPVRASSGKSLLQLLAEPKRRGTLTKNLDDVHMLFKLVYDMHHDADGYITFAQAGNFAKKMRPDFDLNSYGFSKYLDYFSAFPERYELKSKKGAYSYKCK